MNRTKKILEWIEAYCYLVDEDTKYFELSINEKNHKRAKLYREISDYFNERIKELISASTS
jgi:hypothetical protein